MKKIFLFFISILFINANLFAQNSLKGKVVDVATNNALAATQIYIADLKTGAIADADGNYAINNLPQGTYLVEAKLLGYATVTQVVTVLGDVVANFNLTVSKNELHEVVITGTAVGTDLQHSPAAITEVSHDYLNEHSGTNVIDALSNIPGVSAMTDGQSVAKPVIRGLGYNRVLTLNDGVMQMDQPWFDEFGIEVDPNSVDRAEILKGPASLAYGSDAVAGVINLIPEKPLTPGEMKGDVLFNYQTNNGLIDNMVHVAGNTNGIAWSGRIDNIMAHAYQNANDGYVLNSQFSNFNADGTIGIHRKWGYSQIHGSYFDMATGIVDGTRDSSGTMLQANNSATNGYEVPTNQMFKSYTPLVINQRIRHTKLVWDNSVAVGKGRFTALFSFQKNQRQETNDPTIPNTPDIYYLSNAATYDVRYIFPQSIGFNLAVGSNGAYQESKSLGTVMLIPDYNFLQMGGFAIASKQIGKLNISGGLRYDNRTFNGIDHWVDSTTQAATSANAANAFHEFNGFTHNYNGISGSVGATYDFTKNFFGKINVARGFRAPNVAECGANGVHDGTPVYEMGDNNLKPETSLEEDVTLGYNAKDFSIEANGFLNDINNFIYAKSLQSYAGGDSINNSLSAVGLGSAPVYQYSNGKAEMFGGEIGLNIHPSALPWVELNSTFSIVDGGLKGVADSVKYLPFVPPTKITTELKFNIKSVGKSLKNVYIKVGMIDVMQQSHVYLQSAVYNGLMPTTAEYIASQSATKGYVLFSAGIGGNVINKEGKTVCKIYVVGNNLFNTAYMDYMNRFKYLPVNLSTGRVGVFNMGRNISVKVIVPLDFKK